MPQRCHGQTPKRPGSTGINRTRFGSASGIPLCHASARRTLLPVVTPETPRLPGGAFSVGSGSRKPGFGSLVSGCGPRIAPELPCHSRYHSQTASRRCLAWSRRRRCRVPFALLDRGAANPGNVELVDDLLLNHAVDQLGRMKPMGRLNRIAGAVFGDEVAKQTANFDAPVLCLA